MRISSLAVLALGFGTAVSSTVETRFAFNGLIKRQEAGNETADVPASCQSACAAVEGALNTCTDTDCCSNTIDTNLASCFQCAVNASPKSNASLVQSTLQTIMNSALYAKLRPTVSNHTLTNGDIVLGASPAIVMSVVAVAMLALALDYLVSLSLLSAQNDAKSTTLRRAALNSHIAIVQKLLVQFPSGPGVYYTDIKNAAGLSPPGEAENIPGWDEGAKRFVEVMNLEEGVNGEEELQALEMWARSPDMADDDALIRGDRLYLEACDLEQAYNKRVWERYAIRACKACCAFGDEKGAKYWARRIGGLFAPPSIWTEGGAPLRMLHSEQIGGGLGRRQKQR
ncbi:hypothetical protein A0H81_06671 [Grifola frondosa]|uniref:Uncharacterized protein n=1 Tax=Grifola frondosa TaxID=5627 RepID=A0A1C7M8D5_GRIFR|nr:hypothetical protein A0H81_06671 [Grifola frondosa]